MFWLILLIVVAVLCALVLFLVAPAAGRKELRTPFAGRNFAHRGYFGKDQRPPENSLPAFAAAGQQPGQLQNVIDRAEERAQADRKSTRLNSSHRLESRMPSSA